MKNPLKICDLVLRDGHQSLLATRMRTDDMLPIAEKMDRVGYWAVEMWGGATLTPPCGFWTRTPGTVSGGSGRPCPILPL